MKTENKVKVIGKWDYEHEKYWYEVFVNDERLRGFFDKEEAIAFAKGKLFSEEHPDIVIPITPES